MLPDESRTVRMIYWWYMVLMAMHMLAGMTAYRTDPARHIAMKDTYVQIYSRLSR